MEWVLGILAGISLSAACGFRVFVPMLVMSVAVHAGHLEPASGFQWLGSSPSLLCFAVATAVEIAAYFIPVVNNLLDAITTPIAAVAGTILTASMVGDVSPWLRWVLAALTGGAVAGGIQLATVSLRSAATPVAGSGVISALENGAAVVTSILAVVLPVLTAVLLSLFGVYLVRRKQIAPAGIE